MKKLITLAACVLMTVSIAGCGVVKKEESKEVHMAYTYIRDNTFTVKDGKVAKDQDFGENVIEDYLDPICPACAQLEQLTKDKTAEVSKKLPIRYHVSSFLDKTTPDHYSKRAGSIILAMAEVDPDRVLTYLDKTMDGKFAPKEGSGTTTDDSKFSDMYFQIGGTKENWDRMKETAKPLEKVIEKNTAQALISEDLKSKAKDGEMTLPFIIIGKSEKALNFSGVTDARTYYLEEVEKYKG